MEAALEGFRLQLSGYLLTRRQYGLDRRTAKKKYLGITNKTKRKKESKLDKHQDLIKTKLNIPGVNKKAVYEYIIMNIDFCYFRFI